MCIIIFHIIYTGRYAEGRSCRGMDHYSNREKQPVGVAGSDSSLNFIFEEGGSKDETNWRSQCRSSEKKPGRYRSGSPEMKPTSEIYLGRRKQNQ